MYNICGLFLLTAQAGQGRWLPLPTSVLLKVSSCYKKVLPSCCCQLFAHWVSGGSFSLLRSLAYNINQLETTVAGK